MYFSEIFCDQSLVLVISPRGADVKVLCVSLTQTGRSYFDHLRAEAMRLKQDSRDCIISHIPETQPLKFYFQVPFELSGERCTVALE